MAGLRQRRPPNSHASDPRRKSPGASIQMGPAPHSGPGDGWQVPTEIARRRLSKKTQSQGSPAADSALKQGGKKEAVSAEGGAPAVFPVSPASGTPKSLGRKEVLLAEGGAPADSPVSASTGYQRGSAMDQDRRKGGLLDGDVVPVAKGVPARYLSSLGREHADTVISKPSDT